MEIHATSPLGSTLQASSSTFAQDRVRRLHAIMRKPEEQETPDDKVFRLRLRDEVAELLGLESTAVKMQAEREGVRLHCGWESGTYAFLNMLSDFREKLPGCRLWRLQCHEEWEGDLVSGVGGFVMLFDVMTSIGKL